MSSSRSKGRNNILFATLLAGSMLGTSVYAIAQDEPPPAGDFGPGGPGGPGGHHHDHGGPYMHMLKDLDLTDAQRDTIRSYVKSSHANGRADFEAMHAMHGSFDMTVPGSAGYQTVVAQLADAESAAVRNHVQAEAALRTQIYGVLTDAQKAKLATALATMPEPPARQAH